MIKLKELAIGLTIRQQTVLDNVPASNLAETQDPEQQRPGNDASGHMGQTGWESSSSNHLFGRPTGEPFNTINRNQHHPYSMSSLPNTFRQNFGSSMPQYRDNRDMVQAYHGLDNQLRHNLQPMQHLHHRHAAPSVHVHHNRTRIPQHNAPTFHPHTAHQTTNTHPINSHFIRQLHTTSIPPNNYQLCSLHHPHHHSNMHSHVRQYVPSQFHPLTTYSTTNSQLVMSHQATQANPESNAHFIPALNLPDEDEEIYTLETPLVDQHVVTQARIPTLNLPGEDMQISTAEESLTKNNVVTSTQTEKTESCPESEKSQQWVIVEGRCVPVKLEKEHDSGSTNGDGKKVYEGTKDADCSHSSKTIELNEDKSCVAFKAEDGGATEASVSSNSNGRETSPPCEPSEKTEDFGATEASVNSSTKGCETSPPCEPSEKAEDFGATEASVNSSTKGCETSPPCEPSEKTEDFGATEASVNSSTRGYETSPPCEPSEKTEDLGATEASVNSSTRGYETSPPCEPSEKTEDFGATEASVNSSTRGYETSPPCERSEKTEDWRRVSIKNKNGKVNYVYVRVQSKHNTFRVYKAHFFK